VSMSSTNFARYYSYDITNAPWLQDTSNTDEFKAQIGWMIESLEIDPHDSNHCAVTLYLTISREADNHS